LSKVPRDRAIDACAFCHSGQSLVLRPAFTFRPGDALDRFLQPKSDTFRQAAGVHTTDQAVRLALSRCYTKSEMTCVTCHNPHQNEIGQVAEFSRRCQSCHEPSHCQSIRNGPAELADRCVDCHMPARHAVDTKMVQEGQEFSPVVRDHWIRVWADSAEVVRDDLRERGVPERVLVSRRAVETGRTTRDDSRFVPER
jgi:hypothetical protein